MGWKQKRKNVDEQQQANKADVTSHGNKQNVQRRGERLWNFHLRRTCDVNRSDTRGTKRDELDSEGIDDKALARGGQNRITPSSHERRRSAYGAE
ncbi:hypothetical protein R1flu_000839 [Riccia fluitans]|uniref:Uncharacterized protein n=1 Tax=Riccia fluitans TaxID=41844 RepID=A0ABD1Y2J3_9MARC